MGSREWGMQNGERGMGSGELGMEQLVDGRPDLRERTKQYALRIIRLVEALPDTVVAQVIARQLLRAGTSVGANYRAACRSRSQAEFIAKMGIVEEEADESLYWMELLVESRLVRLEQLAPLMQEGDELVAMTVASIKTARKNRRNRAR